MSFVCRITPHMAITPKSGPGCHPVCDAESHTTCASQSGIWNHRDPFPSFSLGSLLLVQSFWHICQRCWWVACLLKSLPCFVTTERCCRHTAVPTRLWRGAPQEDGACPPRRSSPATPTAAATWSKTASFLLTSWLCWFFFFSLSFCLALLVFLHRLSVSLHFWFFVFYKLTVFDWSVYESCVWFQYLHVFVQAMSLDISGEDEERSNCGVFEEV